jgi:hypothetical protein
MSRKSCPINLLPGYRNQPIPRLLRVGIHYVQKEGWGRWHGLRLTDVPAAANLPRLLEKSQRLNACAFNPQSGVIQSLHSFREVSMPENQEVLRQALLTDLARSAKISTRPGLLC